MIKPDPFYISQYTTLVGDDPVKFAWCEDGKLRFVVLDGASFSNDKKRPEVAELDGLIKWLTEALLWLKEKR